MLKTGKSPGGREPVGSKGSPRGVARLLQASPNAGAPGKASGQRPKRSAVFPASAMLSQGARPSAVPSSSTPSKPALLGSGFLSFGSPVSSSSSSSSSSFIAIPSSPPPTTPSIVSTPPRTKPSTRPPPTRRSPVKTGSDQSSPNHHHQGIQSQQQQQPLRTPPRRDIASPSSPSNTSSPFAQLGDATPRSSARRSSASSSSSSSPTLSSSPSFAGSKWQAEPPSPSAVPKPPSRWLGAEESCGGRASPPDVAVEMARLKRMPKPVAAAFPLQMRSGLEVGQASALGPQEFGSNSFVDVSNHLKAMLGVAA